MKVNFYWKGRDFQFLNRLTIISHIIVGHEVVIWIEGKHPGNRYWISDLEEVEIKDATEIYKTWKDAAAGACVRSVSDIWSFYFGKLYGEYYSDTDAIALKHWPDQDILLPTYDNKVVSVGVFRLPKNHPIFNCAIKKRIRSWGNVYIFTKCVRLNGLDSNVPNEMFYPVHCGYNESEVLNCRGKFFDDIVLPDNSVSYHYWGNSVSKLGVSHRWVDKPELQNSLFKRFSDMVFKDFSMVNR